MAYVYQTPDRPIRVTIPDTPERPIRRIPGISQSLNSAFRRINFNSPYLSYSTPVKNQDNNQNNDKQNPPNAPQKEQKQNDYQATPKKLDFEDKQKIVPPPPMKRQREFPLDELVEGMPKPKRFCLDK